MGNRPCIVHCPDGGGRSAAGMIAAAVVAIYVLWQVAVVLAVAAAAAAVLVAALAYASRRFAWRLGLVTQSTAAAVARQDAVIAARKARGRREYSPARAQVMRALPAPAKAIEAPRASNPPVVLSAVHHADK